MSLPLDQDFINSKRTLHEGMRTLGDTDIDALATLLQTARAVMPVVEAKDSKPHADGFVVALRHDVDHDLENAVAFAEFEAKLGVRSTFYLLHTDWYYRPGNEGPPGSYLLEAAGRIAELGHEIAVHNNAITAALQTGGDPIEILAAEINYLRSEGFDIRGSVAHGDPLCHKLGYVNYEVFAEMPRAALGAPDREITYADQDTGKITTVRLAPTPMAELGLEYEGNATPRTVNLSDSGGALSTSWEDLTNQISDEDILHILAHPVWWALGSEKHTPRVSPHRNPPGSRLIAAVANRSSPEAKSESLESANLADAKLSRPETSSYDKRYAQGGFRYAENRDKWVEWVKQHYIDAFQLRPAESLLDVGCGDGFWTSLFTERGFNCTGVDLSATGIETAEHLYRGAEFFVKDAEKPLFDPPRQFDIVFCRGISHLCMKPLMNPRSLAAMSSMAECVAPGGLFLLSYSTQRNHENDHTCADHMVSDLTGLLEPFLDPFRFELVGSYVQIAAQRRDAPRK